MRYARKDDLSLAQGTRMARKMDLLETAVGLLSWSLRLKIMN